MIFEFFFFSTPQIDLMFCFMSVAILTQPVAFLVFDCGTGDDNEIFNGDDSKVLVEVSGARYTNARNEATVAAQRAFAHTWRSWFSDAAKESRRNAIRRSKACIRTARSEKWDARYDWRARRRAAMNVDKSKYLHQRLITRFMLKTAQNSGLVFRSLYTYKESDKSEEAAYARERANAARSLAAAAFAKTLKISSNAVKKIQERLARLLNVPSYRRDNRAIEAARASLRAQRARARSVAARVAAQKKAFRASTFSCADMSGDAREARRNARDGFEKSVEAAKTAFKKSQRIYAKMNRKQKKSSAGQIAFQNTRRARRAVRRALRNAEAHFATTASCIGKAATKLNRRAASLAPDNNSADASELRRAAILSKASTLRGIDRAGNARTRTIANAKFDVKDLTKRNRRLKTSDKGRRAQSLRNDLIEARAALKAALKRNMVGLAAGRSLKLSLEAASFNCGTMTEEARAARRAARVARANLVQKAVNVRSYAKRRAAKFRTRDNSPKAVRARKLLAKARKTVTKAVLAQEKAADKAAVCVTGWGVRAVSIAAGLKRGDRSGAAKTKRADAAALRAGVERAYKRALALHDDSVQIAKNRAKKLAGAVADFNRRDVSDRARNARFNARMGQKRLKAAIARRNAFVAIVRAGRLALIAAGYACHDFSAERTAANRNANKASDRAIQAAQSTANKAGRRYAKAARRAEKFSISDVTRGAINARRSKRAARNDVDAANSLLRKLQKAAAKEAKRQSRCAKRGAKVLKRRVKSCTKNCGKLRKLLKKAKKLAKKLAKRAVRKLRRALRKITRRARRVVRRVVKAPKRISRRIARKLRKLRRALKKAAKRTEDGTARKLRERIARLLAGERRFAKKVESERRQIAKDNAKRIAALRKASEAARIKAQKKAERLAAKLMREKTEAQAGAFRAAESRVTGRILSTVGKIDRALGSLETKEALVHAKLTKTARSIINAEVDVLRAAKDAKEAAKNAASVTRKNTADTNAALSYAKDAAKRASKNAATVAAQVAIDAVSSRASKRLRSAVKEARTKQYRKDLVDMAPKKKKSKKSKKAAAKKAFENSPSALDQAADLRTMKILQKFKLQRKLRDAPLITKKLLKDGRLRVVKAKMAIDNSANKYVNTCNGPTCAFQVQI
jgi:hypothetical protein